MAVIRERGAPLSVGARVACGAVALVLLALVAGYTQRLALLHYYMKYSDPVYAQRYAAFDRTVAPKYLLGRALMDFSCEGDAARADYLLAKGVKPADAQFYDAALLCAVGKGNIRAVEFARARGGDINATSKEHWHAGTPHLTPLQLAADRSDDAMAAHLLQLNAISAKRLSGEGGAKATLTPLQIAAQNRDLDMIRLLLKGGASEDANPAPPIQHYVEALIAASPGEPVAWDQRLAEAADAGLVLGSAAENGVTVLHWAASEGRFDLIDALLKRGLDNRARDARQALPFMRLAAWYDAGSEEPGPELEAALTALTRGIGNINERATVIVGKRPGPARWLEGWALGDSAANRPRLRAHFGRRVNYSLLGGPESIWKPVSREHVAQLLSELPAEELKSATHLAAALRANGWEDLAVSVDSKR